MFMLIKHLPILHVVPAERFLFRQVGPREQRMFQCVARYGYSDMLEEPKDFAGFLVDSLKMFIQEESAFALNETENDETNSNTEASEAQTKPGRSTHSVVHSEEAIQPRVSSHSGRITFHENQAVKEEKQLIDRQVERGVVYLMGEANVSAGPNSSILKKVVVN
uniref:K+ potassium transporter C-terminal domain-containing protein n=1 Tax=Arundo donax TaxID=35708 RepID=A0A0A8YLP7_ARUDO